MPDKTRSKMQCVTADETRSKTRSEKPSKQEKFQEEPMDNYTVRLTSWHARMARRYGRGKIARGIRIAIENMIKDEDD
jgi:predicted metal-dependent peptidase